MQIDEVLDLVAEHIAAGDFATALQLARSKAPNATLRTVGRSLFGSGRRFEAGMALEAWLKEQPEAYEDACDAGIAYKAAGRLIDAERILSELLRLRPDYLKAQALLAEVYFLAGRFQESVEHYDRALALPGSAALRFRREKSAIGARGMLDDPATVFGAIYSNHAWGGRDTGAQFFSGPGSHDAAIVDPYVSAVTGFLNSLTTKPDVVDIGCGDFNVGSLIRPHCARYTAVDVVDPLIRLNKQAYGHMDVNFGVLDITRDAPPPADVFFIREVFQHLSNDQIVRALKNLHGKYRFLIFTEVLPDKEFIPNYDKRSGENLRRPAGSGVVLTASPFNLRVASERRLNTALRPSEESVIETIVYEAPN